MNQVEGVAAILIKDNKVAAFKRKFGKFKGYYEFVGGKIEPNETHETALKRECLEECAIEIDIHHFFERIDYDYDDFHLILHCYVCSLVSTDITLTVHDELVWLTEQQLDSINWLPADLLILDQLRKYLEMRKA